jgi:cyclopropane-fatty-acyl-phospholipid synthase
MQHGEITVHDGDRVYDCGSPAEDGLKAVIRIRDPLAYYRMGTGGSLGAAEAYLRGEWDCDDLVALVRIFCRNINRVTTLEKGIAQISNQLSRVWHWLSRNTLSGSRRNIAAHYDMSNEFFETFLDPTMMYSSGIFTEESASMLTASQTKLQMICEKLQLKPEDHVLEIGTGWGGFAEYAVKHYGCQVTTTTISQQQYDFAQVRFTQSGFQDRIHLLQDDYRMLSGTYDKLVSIEMIEAVGEKYLPDYFQKCESLLKPGGKMLIQAILMPDNRYAAYCRKADFIQRYIFPGGHLPSIAAIQSSLSPVTNLRLLAIEQFPQSYALTLKAWRENFHARSHHIQSLGFDQRFIRMWHYYLTYCEGAFWEEATTVAHLLWHKLKHQA